MKDEKIVNSFNSYWDNMNTKNKLILVVDDEKDIRNIITYNLEKEGMRFIEASNGDEALILLKKNPSLIILDVMMPGQSGYELTKEVKKKIKVPIILLTAKGEVENRIKGLELGADDYLGKPFEPKELLLRIRNIINKSNKIDLKST